MGSNEVRIRRGLLAVLAIAAWLVSMPVAPAAAASTQIGAVTEIAGGLPPDPLTGAAGDSFFAVQVDESRGTYAVPPGYGVITAWRHRTGGTAGDLTFKVYHPTGVAGEFLVLGSDTRAVTPGAVHAFPVRIPVRAGDRIGISTTTVEVGYVCPGRFDIERCNDPAEEADQVGVFSFRQPDPAVETRATLDGPPFQGLRLDVAATVETDADRDGFGDVTQDACPASAAATHPPCPRAKTYPLPPTPPPGTPLPPFAGCPASATSLIRGSSASDTLTGTARGDRILSGAGDDRVDARDGDDCLDLGTGADRGDGGLGSDLLLGGGGNDRLSGGGGRDRMSGGSGRDSISGGSSNDRMAGDTGNDRLNGSSGNDSMKGNSGSDRLTGGKGGDRISGGSGNDRISARDRKRDRISCGRGRDRVSADRIDRVARDCERVR